MVFTCLVISKQKLNRSNMKKFNEFFLNEKDANNRDVNKTKEILNNVRNIMMLKPDMTFTTIMYNALDTTDLQKFDDEDILSKLQKYELFLKDNQ